MTDHAEYVSPREFYAALAELKSLVITLHANQTEVASSNHRNTGAKLSDLEDGQHQISETLKAHIADDKSVERRVTVVEESQKRTMWVAFAALPSGLAAWEWLKHTLKLN